MTYFPTIGSIIGAGELDDRVRNGIGYGLSARITRSSPERVWYGVLGLT